MDTAATGFLYSVEVSVDSDQPKVLDGEVFTREWKRLPTKGVTGVATINIDRFCPLEMNGAGHGLFGYAQANALRWCFLAHASNLCIVGIFKTRLVKHSVSFKLEMVEKAQVDEISGNQNYGVLR